MNAREARELSERNSPVRPRVVELLECVLKRIEEAARNGKRAIQDPLFHLRTPVAQAEHDAVRKQITDLGYRYEDMDEHDRPAPGRYSTIHW